MDGSVSHRLPHHRGAVAKGRLCSGYAKNTAIRTGQLFQAASPSFRERPRKAGAKNAPQIWGDSLTQVKKGWPTPTPPVELDEDGRPKGCKARMCNIAFRFGVEQAA